MDKQKRKSWIEAARRRLYPSLHRRPVDLSAYFDDYNCRRAR